MDNIRIIQTVPETKPQQAGFFPIMSPVCLHCGKEIKTADGMFYALMRPYYASIHRWCAPFYSYPNTWPHTFPYTYYNNKGSEGD